MSVTAYRFNRYLALTFLAMSLVTFLSGCEETPSATATNQASQSIDHAQRLLRATRQHLTMTGPDIVLAGQIDPAAKPQVKRLARSIANRMVTQTVQPFEQTIARIQQLQQDFVPGDDETLAQISKLLRSCAHPALLSDNVDNLRMDENTQRFTQAVRKLRAAISQAKETGQTAAQLGPELVHATSQLMLGRNHRTRLDRRELDVTALRIGIGQITFPIVVEQTHDVELDSYRPDPTIATLNARLQGNPEMNLPGLTEQLALAEENVLQLSSELKDVQDEIDAHTSKAARIHHQYLSLLNQADKLAAMKRYQLQKKAYALRGGTGDSTGHNGIYYEMQAELAQSRLAVISSRLSIAQLQLTRLAELTARTQGNLSEYSRSSIFEQISAARQESNFLREQLTTQLKSLVADLKAAEADYAAVRLDAVTAYRKAITIYRRISRSRRRDQTGQYARDIMTRASAELASLWRSDAMHYRTTDASLATLGNIPELAEDVGRIRRNAQHLAAQAQASADELAAEAPQSD